MADVGGTRTSDRLRSAALIIIAGWNAVAFITIVCGTIGNGKAAIGDCRFRRTGAGSRIASSRGVADVGGTRTSDRLRSTALIIIAGWDAVAFVAVVGGAIRYGETAVGDRGFRGTDSGSRIASSRGMADVGGGGTSDRR